MTSSPSDKPLKTPLTVALTGGIASGKSTALALFNELGASTLSADLIARTLTEKDSPLLTDIVKAFGSNILNKDGELNRAALGEIVFSSKKERIKLEDLIHPEIRRVSAQQINEYQNLKEPPPLIVYEIPLYFESRFSYPEIDKVILVYAPREILIKRLTTDRGLSLEEAEQRLSSQMDIEEKKEKVDYLLDNSQSNLKDLKLQAEEVYRTLTT